ncbi:MAG: ABC transporter substrate-binding protein [Betaproteobacteria bacterium]|nr:MAG: ABC transporter substrate-binding protein [Betaproteobacteria bacterium]
MKPVSVMLGAYAAVLAALAGPAANAAQEKISDGVVRIGVMNDLSGPYAYVGGPYSVYAAQMAIDDFGGKVLGKPIELLSIDHQNKPDIASNKAREWFDQDKVDILGEVAASATSLAAIKIAKEKNKIVLLSGPAATRITNEDCTPITAHWTYDTYALAAGTGRAVVKDGGDSWFFITVDYTFGHSLEKDTADMVKASGGKVLGSVRHPFPTTDFSSFLLQAQASGAKVIGLANGGTDTLNAIKQASEFGITPKQRIAGLLMTVSDVHALGLKAAQGTYITEAFYWDMNNETRAWSKRFFEKMKRMPNEIQAGVYSSITHYLKAVKAAGTDATGAVMAKMKAMPVNDMFAKNGKLREDGRMVHDMYLLQVKKPEESKYPWDYYHVRQTIPGDQAFIPLSKSTCPLVKK